MMRMSDFDYGDKKADGQHERHPVNVEGEYVAPVRHTYIHTCGGATKVPQFVAETYAKNPKFYGKTFCVGCKDYFPVGEFMWDNTDIKVGDLLPIKNKMKACKITFSLELLLNKLGLDRAGDLVALSVWMHSDKNITIAIGGDHPDLPEMYVGEEYPEAYIECKTVQSKIKLT